MSTLSGHPPVGELGVKMSISRDRIPLDIRQAAFYSQYGGAYYCDYLENRGESSKFISYADEDIDMTREVYVDNRFEGKGDVNPTLLDKFVNRMMLANYMSDDETGFGITSVDDGRQCVPDYISRVPPRSMSESSLKGTRKKEKKEKGRKKKSLSRKEEEELKIYKSIPQGSKLAPDRTFTVGVNEFRKYVNEELDSRARAIHEFYERQWQQMNADRLESLRELVACQDALRRLQRDKEVADKEISIYRKTTQCLQERLKTALEAKKRRKQNKKQRKSGVSQYLSGSRDDGGCSETTSATDNSGTISE